MKTRQLPLELSVSAARYQLRLLWKQRCNALSRSQTVAELPPQSCGPPFEEAA
jgi:hypothetical protein